MNCQGALPRFITDINFMVKNMHFLFTTPWPINQYLSRMRVIGKPVIDCGKKLIINNAQIFPFRVGNTYSTLHCWTAIPAMGHNAIQ